MRFKAILSNKAHPEWGQATIPFPIPDSEYDRTISRLEGMGIGSLTAQDCHVDRLDSHHLSLNRLAGQNVNVDELDYLAKQLYSFYRNMDIQFEDMADSLCLSNIKDFINLAFCCQQSMEITDFSDLERVGKDHALTITASLDRYEFIEGVTCDKELGSWLLEHGQAGVDVPEAARPYLDYARIGAEYYASHGGAYALGGYVKRRDAAQEQAVEAKSKISVTLASPTGSVRLKLPASEDNLEQAKKVLRLDSLENAIIRDVGSDYPPLVHLLPKDGITLEAANTLAERIQEMAVWDLRKFFAALCVENPSSFREAVTIAMNCDDYEMLSGCEEEYSMDTLRSAGAGDEILKMLDGFTDFNSLGRFEMVQDGVWDTEYGVIKRLSTPFPPQDLLIVGPLMC